MVVPNGTSHTADITFNEGTSYYESTKMTLHILVVDSASGQNKPLTVSMADWEEGDKPNKPTVTGLPETPYNYNVTYAKKDGTALSAVPTDAGEYTVTVTCEDLENNTYSGSANFTVWKKYTVTFDPNGGQLPTGASATATTQNGKLSALPTPTWDGYAFKGWYTEKTGGGKVDTSTAFSSDTTLYAHWEKKVTSLAFTMTGYGYKKIVKETKLTQANEGITCDFAKYDESYFICAKNGKPTSDTQFQKDKAYYISVTFGAKGGYTLRELEEKNVLLNGIPAMELEFSMNAKSSDEVCVALFELPAIHIIEINCGKNGSITYGDTTYKGAKTVTVSVLHGENATFTITPDKGYSRSKLWIDGDQQSKTAKEYTFKEVSDSKHTLRATFAKASDNPKTGDESHIELALDAMFIAAGALAAAFILKIKKKNLKK